MVTLVRTYQWTTKAADGRLWKDSWSDRRIAAACQELLSPWSIWQFHHRLAQQCWPRFTCIEQRQMVATITLNVRTFELKDRCVRTYQCSILYPQSSWMPKRSDKEVQLNDTSHHQTAQDNVLYSSSSLGTDMQRFTCIEQRQMVATITLNVKTFELKDRCVRTYQCSIQRYHRWPQKGVLTSKICMVRFCQTVSAQRLLLTCWRHLQMPYLMHLLLALSYVPNRGTEPTLNSLLLAFGHWHMVGTSLAIAGLLVLLIILTKSLDILTSWYFCMTFLLIL